MTDEERTIIEIKKTIVKNIEEYINGINPCSLCEGKGQKELYDEECSMCCFFYASHFKLAE